MTQEFTATTKIGKVLKFFSTIEENGELKNEYNVRMEGVHNPGFSERLVVDFTPKELKKLLNIDSKINGQILIDQQELYRNWSKKAYRIRTGADRQTKEDRDKERHYDMLLSSNWEAAYAD